MSYWENKYEPINRKGYKSEKRTISLLLTRKKKRKKNNFKRFNEDKKVQSTTSDR